MIALNQARGLIDLMDLFDLIDLPASLSRECRGNQRPAGKQRGKRSQRPKNEGTPTKNQKKQNKGTGRRNAKKPMGKCKTTPKTKKNQRIR